MSDEPAASTNPSPADEPMEETPAAASEDAEEATDASAQIGEMPLQAEASVERLEPLVDTPIPEEVAQASESVQSEAADSEIAPVTEEVVDEQTQSSEEEALTSEPQVEQGEPQAAESTDSETPAAVTSEAPAKPKRSRKKAATTDEAAIEEPAQQGESKRKWYAIKVQSGREESIKAAILRKVAIEGLEEYLGRIEIPVEEVVEKKQVCVKDKKTGEYSYQEKKVTKKKKKFHGYIFAELEFNDRILYLFRETSGVGDFLNMRGKPPVPEAMPEHEVQAMLTGERQVDPSKKGKAAKVVLTFEKGDRVRIREGPFANSEGEVKMIAEPKDPTESPKVTVVVTLWGRPVDVELEYWQVDKV